MKVVSTELPSGWLWVKDAQERRELERELARELPQQHILVGKPARLLARHVKRDNFLFRTVGSEVAQVHLTWSIETDPFFPDTRLFPTLEEWTKTDGIMK